ncbi:septum formation inhibitor Maf [Gelidibacter salicanalis]|uniref:Septum formation inhibitor Maf n=1 Tax=Gelidibacter salicanalis TaxID=291193 RepID=A0A934NKD3_9FLAO|nr:septum formation inhibitor Maf [Gelidibacter salicanalis]MBJ7879992.1 septum formation inhibitor Maf [Gelidibacter salicanalis]
MKLSTTLLFVTAFCLIFISCKNEENTQQHTEKQEDKAPQTLRKAEPLSEDFKAYWYQGEAEITTYALEQARYGEIRKGTAVLVFVTEPFLKSEQVKADQPSSKNSSVLKLNATKNFNTGIYPYSIMQSVFYPVSNNQHALKISCSVQEWCGQVYMQLNNRSDFEVRSHSYFEGEADEEFSLNKSILENELWTQLRIDPKSLPTGNVDIIPSFEFLRLRHIPFKTYSASAELTQNTYTLTYPDLNRSFSITFNPQSPFDIISWEETFISGQGNKAQELTTKATRIKSIKSDYWNKNSNADIGLRESLGLD